MQTSAALPAQQLAEYSSFAQTLADRVRPLSRKWFRHPLSVDTKADESPVTQADREVEAALRDAIAQHYPHHGIFGEEFGALHTEADLVWSLDPIDGTRAFISGNPLWGTLLALLHRGRPVLGLIDIPMLQERWIGAADSPARLNGDVCQASACTELRDAILYATSPDIFEGAELAAFDALTRAARMRRYGGDCYSYGLLASGHVDLVVEAGLQPYDYLALMPVIEGAGGVITDWSGQPLSLESQGRVVAAATPQLHRQAMRVLGAAMN
ncbi:histidinol-phosphatase [Achromobacter sp. Bel]|uniref:histidinol-phosphatase n=1 Tax=Achromobacter sp. Bel TaxID=2727415 RepID=UPI00145CD62D|nr:histidinol-phosphatase [Achromobacter sp. Bel]NMK45770.1 histidinol-phosphatase [Achromobacter sp. Bel]